LDYFTNWIIYKICIVSSPDPSPIDKYHPEESGLVHQSRPRVKTKQLLINTGRESFLVQGAYMVILMSIAFCAKKLVWPHEN